MRACEQSFKSTFLNSKYSLSLFQIGVSLSGDPKLCFRLHNLCEHLHRQLFNSHRSRNRSIRMVCLIILPVRHLLNVQSFQYENFGSFKAEKY